MLVGPGGATLPHEEDLEEVRAAAERAAVARDPHRAPAGEQQAPGQGAARGRPRPRAPACSSSAPTARGSASGVSAAPPRRIRRERRLPGLDGLSSARPLPGLRSALRSGRMSGSRHPDWTDLSRDRGEDRMAEKMWGEEPFWGLGYDWDPDWVLTDRQRELRETLIGLCESEMRANAKRSDDELLYPRRNFELLAEHGFLSLTVPEEYGGLGENHVGFAMVCETLARYGCASTAMCYVMHIGAVATIMLRPTEELVDRYIRPLDSRVPDRHPLLLRPGDGLALLVPGLLRRRALQRRLQGPQEGLLDDLGRLRRLLRRADHQPRLLRLRRPLRVRDRRRRRQGPALALGRAGAARQPVGADRGRRDRGPGRAGGRARSATAPTPTTRRSTPGSWSAPPRSGTGSPSGRSTSPSATRPASATSTSACGSPTTRRSRTTSARR